MRKLYSSAFSSTLNYLHLKEIWSPNLVIVVYRKKSVLICVPSGHIFLAFFPGLYQEEIVLPTMYSYVRCVNNTIAPCSFWGLLQNFIIGRIVKTNSYSFLFFIKLNGYIPYHLFSLFQPISPTQAGRGSYFMLHGCLVVTLITSDSKHCAWYASS